MKKIIVVLVCLLLTGCTRASVNNVYASLDDLLSDLSFKYNNRVNNSATYFSYYLPSDMQEIDGSENASVIVFNSSKTVMNLNISSLVNKAYYDNVSFKDDGFLNEDLLDYENSGEFSKKDDTISNYQLKIYKYSDQYLVHFVSDDINAYSTSDDYDLVELIRHLFIIAKSIEVDTDNVLKNYSTKDIIENERTPNDLFEYITPSSGFLSDLVNSSGGTVIEEFVETVEESQEEAQNEEEIEAQDSQE